MGKHRVVQERIWNGLVNVAKPLVFRAACRAAEELSGYLEDIGIPVRGTLLSGLHLIL